MGAFPGIGSDALGDGARLLILESLVLGREPPERSVTTTGMSLNFGFWVVPESGCVIVGTLCDVDPPTFKESILGSLWMAGVAAKSGIADLSAPCWLGIVLVGAPIAFDVLLGLIRLPGLEDRRGFGIRFGFPRPELGPVSD